MLRIAGAILLLLFIAGKIVMGNMAKGVQNISLMPDLSNVQDGNYTGEASIAPVYVKTAVSVKDHPITEFSILRHDNGLESTAGRIADDGMKEQLLDIDAVLGATVSSKC